MPTYDYQCSSCGKRFDWVQSMKDNALETCPPEMCEQEVKGQGSVQRIISAGGGVIYKGEGFYLTDYARKKGGGSAPSSASSESATKSESTTSSTSDAAPSEPKQKASAASSDASSSASGKTPSSSSD